MDGVAAEVDHPDIAIRTKGEPSRLAEALADLPHDFERDRHRRCCSRRERPTRWRGPWTWVRRRGSISSLAAPGDRNDHDEHSRQSHGSGRQVAKPEKSNSTRSSVAPLPSAFMIQIPLLVVKQIRVPSEDQ